MTLSFTLATIAVFAPFLAGMTGLLRGSSVAARRATGGAAVVSLVACALLLFNPSSLGETVSIGWSSGLGLSLSWRLETAPLALAILISGVGALVLHFALLYFENHPRGGAAVGLIGCFLSAMLGLVLAGDLFLLFVFWELTGISSFFLISLNRKSAEGWSAARQALLLNVGGGLPLLAAIVWIQETLGTTRLADLGPGTFEPAGQTLVLALVLPAVLTKSAQLPFSSWLVGAMAAPTPVSALLHSATMVKAGVILLLFLAPTLMGSPLWSLVLVPVGAATCLWGSYRALTVFDLKQLLAFSTVSQLGILVVTLGLGTEVAIRAATLHLFAHAVFKAGLFLAVARVEKVTGTRDLRELGGLGRTEPRLFVIVAVLAGSMAGIPPLAGFLSKELILKKAMLEHAWTHGIAISAIVLGSIGTVAYSSRLLACTFLGPSRGAAGKAHARPRKELFAPAILALITLVAGLTAPWVDRWFLEPVAGNLVGAPLPVKPLSLWYGLEAAFLVSGAIILGGWLSHRRLGLRVLSWRPPGFLGRLTFDRFLASAVAFGGRVETEIAHRAPTRYFALLFVGALVCIGFGASSGLHVPISIDFGSLVLALALGIGLFAVLRGRGLLAPILGLSAVGLVVALLFRLLAAPDLMLTQVSVEILTTVLFAAALIRLPSVKRSTGDGFSWVRLGLALAGGAGFAALSIGPALDGTGSPMRTFFLEQAPTLAAGANVVNVILTDIRGLDTLIETLVIGLAALGAVRLVKPTSNANKPEIADEELLRRTAPLIRWVGTILAIALLVKGHDQPGGGFVAGLVLAVTLVLGFLSGREPRPSTVLFRGLLFGLGGLLLALLGPIFLGLAPLGHLHGALPMLQIKWHSALIFEVGIAMTVGCAVAWAASTFWSRSR